MTNKKKRPQMTLEMKEMVKEIKRIGKLVPDDYVSIEPDDSLNPHSGIYRLVEGRARRARLEQGSSARPQYIATVYSLKDAIMLATLWNREVELKEGL